MAKSFRRALKHLKSDHKTTKLDEKKQTLNEIPTMHTGGVYSKNPAGFRYDPPSPAKRFIPDVDGNWPAGVPGTPGASEYIRPQGYWVNDSDWEIKFAPNMSNDSIVESPTNTDGFIDAQSGTVKTALPPNSRSFILGPLVDGYSYNHGYDDFTNIGYIQKDTRQFVLLATISGHWDATSHGTGYTARVWDGTSGQFTAYNSNFTLAMAQWFKDRLTANDFTKNFPYFYSGGVFQGPLSPQPPGSPGGMNGGNAPGTGGGGNDPSDGDGKDIVGSGGSPDTGEETPQGDPEGGDAASQGFPWGLGDFIKKKWDEFYNNAQDFGDKLDKGIEDFVDDAMDWAQDKSQDVLDWAGDFFGKDSDLWEYKDAIGDKINALDNWVEDNITDPSGTNRQLFTDFAETVSNWVGEAQQWVTGQDITTSVNLMNDFNQHALDMTNDPNTPGSSWDNPKDVTDRIDKGDMDALNEVTKSEKWQNEIDKYNNGEISKKDLERNLTGQFEDVIYARPGLDQSIHNGSQITNIDEVIAGGNPDIGKQYDFNEGDSVVEGEDDVATYAYSQIMNLPLDAFGTGGNAGAVALYAKYLGLSNADRHNGILNMPPMVMKVTVGDNKSESFRLSKHKTYITEQKITYKPIGKKSKIKAKFEAFKKKHYGKDNLSLYDFLPSFASVSKKSTQKNIKESNTYNKKRIIREITQPLKEIKELPKTQKLKKYRPNFKGKYKAQNTPNVTSSKKSDEMVKAKNAAGQTWRTKDKYWGGYESQERMNVVYDNVGHGDQYWDKIVNENLHKKNIKNRKVQEELNIIAHEKAMRRLDSTFISPFRNIEEQETYDNKIKDPLFSKVSDRLKKEIDYENKPAKKGYPNEAPPEMVNGFHPNYGKRYKYDKLDPQSAESMPVQGNPEIDANVQKALDKRAKNRKIKNLKIDAPTVENVSWKETLKKKNLEELKKGFKKFKHDLKEGMTTAGVMTLTRPAEGDTAIDTVSPIDAASFTAMADVPQPGDNNIANVGTVIRDSGTGSGEDGGFNVGGQYLAFQGTGDAFNNARFAALSPIDSSAVDTFSITAIVGNDINGGEDPDLAAECLFLMYKTPGMSTPRFLMQKPDGSSGEGTGIIINSPLSHDGGLNNYSIAIPEYARAKGTQFVLYQNFSSSADHDNYGITQIKLQRRAPINVVVPLDDPAAISFINVGTTEGDPKKRKKKVQDQLDASNEYVTSQFGDDFPTGANLTSDDDIQASPIGNDEVLKAFSLPKDGEDPDLSSPTFVRGAATAKPEPPSSQTTMEPKTEDGDPINVKTVGGKKSGAVQGADAAALDAQEPETIEPETTEPEVTEPEAIEPEPPDETKTPEEVEEIENEKFNTKADETADYIDKLVNFDLNAGLSSFNAFAQVAGTVVNTAINVISFGANLLGFKTSKEGGYLGGLGKLKNSIRIAQGVLSGKIVNANPLPQEIKSFTDSIKLDEFTANIPVHISDVRHEYADDNIYIKGGKVYSNRDGDREGVYATPLAGRGYKALGVHGNGYAQMIIPKDGSEPYLHYYDHNYENLLSIEDVSVSGGVIQTLKTDPQYRQDGIGPLLKSISNIIHQLKGDNMKFVPQKLRESLVSYFGSFDQVMEGLKSTSSLEGWPPGIHGSALTDFKVPLSKLPQETQDMIASHPLSWTPERIENMSDDQLYSQFYRFFNTEADYDNYFEYVEDITKMSVEPVNTVPYAVAAQELNKLYDQYGNDQLEKYGEGGWEEFSEGLASKNPSEFFASERAAQEDIKTLESLEEQIKEKFQTAIDKLLEEIPDPEGERPEFDWNSDPDVVKYGNLSDEARGNWLDYYSSEYRPAYNAYESYATSNLTLKDGYWYGPESKIARLRELVKPVDKARKELDRLGVEQEKYHDLSIKANDAYIEKHFKAVKPWEDAEEKRRERRKEIDEEYKGFLDEIKDQLKPIRDYYNSQTTRTIREKDRYGNVRWEVGGHSWAASAEVAGGSYTALDGTVYRGKNSYFDEYYDAEDEVLDKTDALYKPVEHLQRYVDGAYVRDNVGGLFENDYGFSPENWSPAKSGDGKPRGGGGKPKGSSSPLGSAGGYVGGDATAAATAAASQKDDDTKLASAGVNYDLYNWYVKTYGSGAAGWYHNNPGSSPSNNPFLRPGSYVPKAQQNGKNNNSMVAHFKPRGKNLFERVSKLRKPLLKK